MQHTISIIIPVPIGEAAEHTLDSLKKIDYPQEKIEVFVVEGFQPSRQRNLAAKQALGDIVYFLDSDSIVTRNLFKTVIDCYNENSVSGVGGPEINPDNSSWLQKAISYVLGSTFGCFTTRYRFAAVGAKREGTEKCFILSNFCIKRDVFIKNNGFNEILYPNEENEFITRLHRKGHRFTYLPDAVVHKNRRESLFKFARQIFIYGRSRMEHVLILPVLSNVIYFIPLMFCVYLVSLVFLHPFLYLLPLYIYALLAVISSVTISVREKQFGLLLFLPLLYLIEHISYGTGFFWGLVKKAFGIKRKFNKELSVHKIKELGNTNYS